MKKIRVRIKANPIAGRYGGNYRPNSVVSVEPDEAKSLIDADFAEYWPSEADSEIAVKKQVEVAAVAPVENAMAGPQVRPKMVRSKKKKAEKKEEE